MLSLSADLLAENAHSVLGAPLLLRLLLRVAAMSWSARLSLLLLRLCLDGLRLRRLCVWRVLLHLLLRGRLLLRLNDCGILRRRVLLLWLLIAEHG